MKAMLKKIFSKPVVMATVGAVAVTATPAFADGFSNANTLLESINSGLRSISIVTVTIAGLWVGYKVLFGGSTIKECAPIIIGAIVLASAAEIANMLVSGV